MEHLDGVLIQVTVRGGEFGKILLIMDPLHISETAVCGVFNAAFAKLLWPFVILLVGMSIV